MELEATNAAPAATVSRPVPTRRGRGKRGRSILRPADERNRLVEAHLHLVHAAAGRLKKNYGRHAQYDDMVATGMEGLIEAADRYDDAKGVPFAAFSSFRIRGAILDGLRNGGWYSRYDIARHNAAKLRAEPQGNELPQVRLDDDAGSPPSNATDAGATPTSIEDASSQIPTVHVTSLDLIHARAEEGFAVSEDALHLTDEQTPTPDELLERQALRERLHRAIETLPPRERSLIELHYFGDEQLQDAGATMGLSKWATSRLHARAVELLRDALAQEGAEA